MATQRPDIILLVLDTHRAERVSSYGYEKETTPTLDEFAADATVFDWGISTAPWTIPSHASMFTGLYPTVHQTHQSFLRLPDSIPTIAELLGQNGYRTVGFCNNPLLGLLDNGLDRGFDRFYNYSGTFPDVPDIGEDATSFTKRAQRAITEGLQSISKPIERQFGRSSFLLSLATKPPFSTMWSRFMKFKGDTTQSLDDVTRYLKVHHATQKDEPLFVFINMMETHLPYYPPRHIIDKWVPYFRKDREVRDFIQDFNTQSYRWMAPMIEPFTEKEQTVLRDMYDAEVAYQDQQLHKMLRYLKRSGRLDNTLVIVTSDHGESHGEHDFMGHAFVVYNELVRVPLIIRHPDLFPAGKRIEHNVSNRRVFQTMLEAAGLQHESYGHSVEEMSLTRSLGGKSAESSNEYVVSEGFPPQNFINVMQMSNPEAVEQFRVKEMRRAIYNGSTKLMRVGGRSDEFFDIEQDPAELSNLLDSPIGYENQIIQLERNMDEFVTIQEAHRTGTADSESIDYSDNPELLERLKALGYIE
ncbi:MAG: sulfatase [Chloroflexi bacterium]|nr:sulfatase [Chloroflexota bacterium]